MGADGEQRPQREQRLGIGLGFFAYGLWGFFPLYWPLLKPAQAGEILALRMLWSLVAMVAIVTFRKMPDGSPGHWNWVRDLLRTPRKVLLLVGAACMVSVNWFTYIWSVNHGHVVDTSLGYFINPLVTVLFGVFLLRERLRRLQWVAVVIGGVAVLVFAVGYGRVPWIALTLAASFGTYGLLKKLAAVPPVDSMFVETAVMFPIAAMFLLYLHGQGNMAFGHHGTANTLLLVFTGPLTVIPLLAFAGAANRLPLSLIGLLQFLAPVLQFLCGVLIQHETVPPARLAGFIIVWLALGVLTFDALRAGRADRAERRAVATATATEGDAIATAAAS